MSDREKVIEALVTHTGKFEKEFFIASKVMTFDIMPEVGMCVSDEDGAFSGPIETVEICNGGGMVLRIEHFNQYDDEEHYQCEVEFLKQSGWNVADTGSAKEGQTK